MFGGWGGGIAVGLRVMEKEAWSLHSKENG